MLILREVLEWDAWDDALDLGILPPTIDFVAADQMEAERREDERQDHRQGVAEAHRRLA